MVFTPDVCRLRFCDRRLAVKSRMHRARLLQRMCAWRCMLAEHVKPVPETLVLTILQEKSNDNAGSRLEYSGSWRVSYPKIRRKHFRINAGWLLSLLYLHNPPLIFQVRRKSNFHCGNLDRIFSPWRGTLHFKQKRISWPLNDMRFALTCET